MATAATRLKLEEPRDAFRSHIGRFTIPTVAASTTSAIYSLDVGTREGILQVVRVASVTGVDYTVSIRCIDGAAIENTVDEILRIENINASGFQGTRLGIMYSNNDEVTNPDTDEIFGGELSLLYVEVTNNDSGAATGLITIELVIESHD